MRLMRWLVPRVAMANPVLALPGVLAVLGAAAYYHAWWAVALTFVLEVTLVATFWWAWAVAVRRATDRRQLEALDAGADR